MEEERILTIKYKQDVAECRGFPLKGDKDDKQKKNSNGLNIASNSETKTNSP